MDFTKLVNLESQENNIKNILKNPLKNIPSFDDAILISKKFNISLHPFYLLYLNELNSSTFLNLVVEVKNFKEFQDGFLLSKKIKRELEIIGLSHKIFRNENILESELVEISQENFQILIANFGYFDKISKEVLEKHIEEVENTIKKNLNLNPLEIINKISKIEIRDKGGTYIGARMGRPEKAKMRKLDGKPNGIFPVGDMGGRMKNLVEAYNKYGYVLTQTQVFLDKDNNFTPYRKVPNQENENEEVYFERYTNQILRNKNQNSVKYTKTKLDLSKHVDEVRNILKNVELPKLVRGVEGLFSKNKICEHLVKSFLRERRNIFVNKDGTIRYDMTEMGLTHFKPIEIGTSIEKLKKLGYEKDYLGKDLVDENQLIEIFPQDVILPDCPIGDDEKASEFVIKTANFVDELLEKFYGLKKFYNFKSIEDTIGHLIIGLAPHTSAGIVGRIIGYSKTQGCFSHPVWHAAQRRNLDGDENGIILLLDGLINFSREYLPDRRGSRTMDTSLVLTTHLELDQIDDEVFGLDIEQIYPKELYEKAKDLSFSKDVKVKKLESKVYLEDRDEKYFNHFFTHNVEDLNDTILYSSYKSLPEMKQKLDKQLLIGKKIRAVNENEVGNLIIDKHFLKDIKGNLRKFGMQSFRCTKCNEIYRRPPLNGKCSRCSNDNVVFTISEGSIKKYLDTSFKIIENYDINPYLVETIELTKLRIDGVFGKEEAKEKSLDKWFKN